MFALDPALKRDAFGAKVTIMLSGKQLTRIIAPGYRYLSSNDPRAHFGLGEESSVDHFEVQWPGGTTETFSGVQAKSNHYSRERPWQ